MELKLLKYQILFAYCVVDSGAISHTKKWNEMEWNQTAHNQIKSSILLNTYLFLINNTAVYCGEYKNLIYFELIYERIIYMKV